MLISLLKMVILHSCWGTELCKLPWDPSLLHHGLARDFFTEKNTICGANSYQDHLIPQQMLAVCAVLDNLSKEHLVLPFASPHRHLAWFLTGLPGISWENLRSLFLLHRILGCCNTARRTCICCRMNCYSADKPRMWLVESRGEGAGGAGQWFGSRVAFSSWEAILNLSPYAGGQKSVPVCDSRRMTWARKKPPVLGGLAGAALVRWLLLLEEIAGFFSVCSGLCVLLFWHK